MDNRPDMERLVQDLQFVKTAITKSNNLFRFINISRAMGLVGLWIGIGITVFASAAYYLVNHFGDFDSVPAPHRTSLYTLMAISLVAAAIGKIVLIMRQVRQTDRNFTLFKLITAVYKPQTVNIIVSFITAIVGLTVFLSNRGMDIYLVPTMSIMFGLMLLAFLNVFYLKELLVSGDWLLITGLITLFNAETLHPLLALIITFGLGFSLLYVANRIMDR